MAETRPAASKETTVRRTEEKGTVREVSTSEVLTETGPVTYQPLAGDPDVTRVFGMLFRKGESVDVDDPRAYTKLRSHPAFQTPESKKNREAGEKREADERAKIDKELDGRSKEARKLRDEAQSKQSEAEAAERARDALAQAADDDEERIPLGRSR